MKLASRIGRIRAQSAGPSATLAAENPTPPATFSAHLRQLGWHLVTSRATGRYSVWLICSTASPGSVAHPCEFVGWADWNFTSGGADSEWELFDLDADPFGRHLGQFQLV